MSLRFLAAIGVFLLHVSIRTGDTLYPGVDVAHWPSWLQVLHEGYYRQTFFLMLSGFVLTYVYATRIERGMGPRFWLRRVARIWPLHALMLLVMLAPDLDDLVATPRRTGSALLANATLLHGWFPTLQGGREDTFAQSFNGPSWALSSELLAYLLFPLLAGWLLPRLRARTAAIGAVAIWLAVAGIGAAASTLPHDTAIELVYTFAPARLLDFVVGILLAVIFAAWTTREQAAGRSSWGRGGSSLGWTLAEVGVFALLALSIAERGVVSETFRFVAWYMPTMAAIILVCACGRGAVARALSRRELVALGRVSFAFYLVHFPVLVYSERLLGFDGGSVAGVALVFSATLALSFLLHHLFELPMQERITAWGERRWFTPRAEVLVLAAGVHDDDDDEDSDLRDAG
jgi:peptidoglycan/LPS O-acetylase OafA/YrhL